ncbi:FAD-dependent monooxygenase [Actinoallomurus acaciae]|uniref:FAD-dependent monooxygenase n=1 Tax=Actinoallomurus acaciae TaxID=502577 RepID=A0ABV5YQZ9_9ACTN
MTEQTVLISGAGIAGPTLAYFLGRRGFRPTVVEHAHGTRSSGSPVDVRGPAVRVAEQMGVMPRLRAAATGVTGMRFVDAAARRLGGVGMWAVQGGAGTVELPRGTLASVLYEAARDHAEFVFGDAIASLEQDAGGVDVTFEHGAPRRFDLVVGADGLHSGVRRLAFGPESAFVRHLGLYVATTPFDGPIEHPHEVVLHNAPGRLAAIHPSPAGPLAFFAYRAPAVPDLDHRDTERHKRMLTEAFADGGWRVPELLDRARAAEDLYFDSVSQVVLSPWSAGRITLLGDAAASVSLFGDGSSLAMAGALTLADALAAAAGAALDNVRRHAGTDASAWVLVEDEGDVVTVSVRDDGPGFAADRLARAVEEGRLGVAQSIVGRMRDVGGTAHVTSSPGQGTEVELRATR